MPALIISINNEKRGIILEAIPGKVVVIGRDAECDVSLPEATGLSRRHCSLTYTADGFMLQDLGSTNGTYADAVKLEGMVLLKEGVKYTIGDAVFQVMGLSLLPLTAKAKTQPLAPQKPDEPKPDTPTARSAPSSAPETSSPQAPEKKHTAKHQFKKTPCTTAPAKRMAKALGNKLNPLSQDITTNSLSIVEVLLILIITFYAGLALYSYLHGGSMLPPFFD